MSTSAIRCLKCGIFSVLELTGTAIIHTGSLFSALSFQDAQGKRQSLTEQVSAAIPIVLCLILLALLRPDTGMLASVKLFLFVLATPPLVCAGFYLTGMALGGEARFGTLCMAWLHTYWATDLFLLILFISHTGAALFGLTPAEIPTWLGFIFLSLYLCAGIWKFLSTVGVLRVILGLRGWRLAVAVLTLLFAAACFAVVSALVLGTKIPIV
jgi:hypothetical protein